jgi:NitT/TauT family transport system ATP-binding protein
VHLYRATPGLLDHPEFLASTANSLPFVRLTNAAKAYRKDGAEFIAVSDVSFEIAAGDFVSLVGPSGCGKTTVLKMLAGLLEPSQGKVAIGNPENPFRPGRDVGMVFQQALLLKWRTILDNVLLPAEILGLRKAESKARAKELLVMVGLHGFEARFPYELSGGMQQRASIARALIHDPKLLLMDEPFGALDALTRDKMNLELLNIWRQFKKTIVFVTHDIAEAVFLGTRVVVLTSRPARMLENIPILLPPDRTLDMKTHEDFCTYTRKIYKLLGVE